MPVPRSAVALALIACLAWLGATRPALGQEEIQSQQAQAEAPQAVPHIANPELAPMMMMPSPNAFAVFNRKQQNLRDHHRPIPIGKLPAGVQAMAAPQLETAS